MGMYWWNGNDSRHRRTGGPLRASTFMPSFPEVETSFWRMYGWQTAGALLAGVVGALGWIFYASSLVVLGMGAMLYYVMFSIALMCGIGLPIRYYRHFKLFRSMDKPEV